MMRLLSLRPLLFGSALLHVLATSPALAQADPAAEIDALSRESASGAGGLALALSQTREGDLLGALATIDRVLMVEPAAGPALLLRASLLCRIDDKAGGNAQLRRLKKRNFDKDDWNQASAACAVPQAAPPQRRERWSSPGF